jgi:hypothetical protein
LAHEVGGSLARATWIGSLLGTRSMLSRLQQAQNDPSKMYILCLNKREEMRAPNFRATGCAQDLRASELKESRAARENVPGRLSRQGRNRRNSHADQQMRADVNYTSGRRAYT